MVEEEYKMFIRKHPHAIILPIASTGAAAKKIYDEQFLDKNERLVKDYAYMSLFQKYLQFLYAFLFLCICLDILILPCNFL